MKKIFIIDDEQDYLYFLVKRLEKQGYIVKSALSGEEGLKQIPAFEPDAILIDLSLPGMDGWEVCRHLRQDPKHILTPIVIITAHQNMGFESQIKDLRLQGVLQKPFTMEKLLNHLTAIS